MLGQSLSHKSILTFSRSDQGQLVPLFSFQGQQMPLVTHDQGVKVVAFSCHLCPRGINCSWTWGLNSVVKTALIDLHSIHLPNPWVSNVAPLGTHAPLTPTGCLLLPLQKLGLKEAFSCSQLNRLWCVLGCEGGSSCINTLNLKSKKERNLGSLLHTFILNSDFVIYRYIAMLSW